MGNLTKYYTRLLTRYYRQLREQKGQTLAEYALILGLIAVVSIVAVTLLGNHVSSLMNTVASTI
jgi:pilus assembly protein Flp/PilA